LTLLIKSDKSQKEFLRGRFPIRGMTVFIFHSQILILRLPEFDCKLFNKNSWAEGEKFSSSLSYFNILMRLNG